MQSVTSFATPLLVHFVRRHGARSPLTPRTLLSFHSQAIINERTPELNYRIALLAFRIPNLRKGLPWLCQLASYRSFFLVALLAPYPGVRRVGQV